MNTLLQVERCGPIDTQFVMRIHFSHARFSRFMQYFLNVDLASIYSFSNAKFVFHIQAELRGRFLPAVLRPPEVRREAGAGAA